MVTTLLTAGLFIIGSLHKFKNARCIMNRLLSTVLVATMFAASALMAMDETFVIESKLLCGKNARLFAVSPDGTQIASVAEGAYDALVINRNNAQLNFPLPVGSLDSLSFNASGTKILTSSPHGVKIFSAVDGTLLDKLNAATYSATFVDEDRIVASHPGSNVTLYNQNLELVTNLQETDLGKADFLFLTASSDGKLVAGASEKGFAVWDLVDEKVLSINDLNHLPSGIRNIQFSPDNKMVATIFGRRAHLYDIEGRAKAINVMEIPHEAITSVAFTLDSTAIIAQAGNKLFTWSTNSKTLFTKNFLAQDISSIHVVGGNSDLTGTLVTFLSTPTNDGISEENEIAKLASLERGFTDVCERKRLELRRQHKQLVLPKTEPQSPRIEGAFAGVMREEEKLLEPAPSYSQSLPSIESVSLDKPVTATLNAPTPFNAGALQNRLAGLGASMQEHLERVMREQEERRKQLDRK